jgi:sulfur-oxidizing protein SoxY
MSDEGVPVDSLRRDVLRAGSGAAVAWALAAAGAMRAGTVSAQAWNKAAFETHGLDATLKALGIARPPTSKDVTFISTPDIAENGAVVPVGVTSAIPNTESIAILIENNPNMIAAIFDIPPGTEPSITTRVKMGETSNVYAFVKADGKYYAAVKEIKVTLGGCGG